MSQLRNVEICKKKPPLPKGRGTTEGGGGIQKRDFVNKKRIPRSTNIKKGDIIMGNLINIIGQALGIVAVILGL